MPKWKEDATEFTVRVTHNPKRGYQSSLPKPMMQKLGNPDYIKFIFKDKNKIEVQSDK